MLRLLDISWMTYCHRWLLHLSSTHRLINFIPILLLVKGFSLNAHVSFCCLTIGGWGWNRTRAWLLHLLDIFLVVETDHTVHPHIVHLKWSSGSISVVHKGSLVHVELTVIDAQRFKVLIEHGLGCLIPLVAMIAYQIWLLLHATLILIIDIAHILHVGNVSLALSRSMGCLTTL